MVKKKFLFMMWPSFTQNDNVSGPAFFKVYWSQNLVWYFWKFEIYLALLIWKI